jgi:outer membrane protein OmpA-like peptidoglycan-associated protein
LVFCYKIQKAYLLNKGVEMKNNIRAIVLTASVISLVGCATPAPSGGGFSAKQISTASYTKKADTFVIIQDASSSMSEEHMGMGHSKLDFSRDLLSNMNQTIPQLDFKAGLTSFNGGRAKVLYGLTEYSRGGLGDAIAGLTSADGPSPMDAGIEITGNKLLTGLGLGKIALFIVSDGIPDASHPGDSGEQSNAIDAAKKIKDQLGDRVCIYPIHVGDEGGMEFMNELARAGGCGFVTHAGDINSPDSMADYVIKTLLGPVAAAAAVDTSPEKITFSADALFDFDRAVLKEKGKQSLDGLMAKLDNVKYDVIVAVGYTDRIGSEDYNKKLSVKRAEAVKSYLVSAHSIDPSNVFVDGKGEANPVTGTTCKGTGRKQLIACLQPDRRVEIEIAGVRE